jgi:PadR family transcriptional regulator
VDIPPEAFYAKTKRRTDVPQDMLDLLILRILLFCPILGRAIAKSIERTSRDILRVDHRSLYPALQHLRLLITGCDTSENNRRARYYRLTLTNRKRLTTETGMWERLTEATAHSLNPKSRGREGD